MQNKMIFFLATIAMIGQVALMMPQPKPTIHQDLADAACVSKAIERLISVDNNATMVMDCGSIFEILATRPGPATGLHERCNDPVIKDLKQTKVVDSGTWWGNWGYGSGCDYCGQSDNACDQTLAYSHTSSATFSENFDMSTQDKVLGFIGGNLALNLGYSWTESDTQTGTHKCEISPGESGRIFVQSKMGWADSQVRNGVSNVGCGGNGVVWEDWSENMRSDWSLQGVDVTNVGCTGHSKEAECT